MVDMMNLQIIKEKTWLPLAFNRFTLRAIDVGKLCIFEMFLVLRFLWRDVEMY